MTFTKSYSPNLRALLDMIAWAEGTAGIGDDGYDVLFGSTAQKPKLFKDYHDHPRIRTYETHDNFIKNGKLDFTTAAGRYQIIKGMYDIGRKRLGLSDFSPASQDAIAVMLIKDKCRLALIDSGKIKEVITLISPIWASLPASREVQRKHSMGACIKEFVRLGGRTEEMLTKVNA